MFKSIVVAFDGSDNANKALEIAVKLAGEGQATLGIIYVIDVNHMKVPDELRRMGEIEHVIEPVSRLMVNLKDAPLSLLDGMERTSTDSTKVLVEYGEFLLTQAVECAQRLGIQQVEHKAALGDVATEIVAYAADRNADLIVTGSRGFGKLKSLLLGSTSHKITQLAECSCLTVK